VIIEKRVGRLSTHQRRVRRNILDSSPNLLQTKGLILRIYSICRFSRPHQNVQSKYCHANNSITICLPPLLKRPVRKGYRSFISDGLASWTNSEL
jgi:hypothetical protein